MIPNPTSAVNPHKDSLAELAAVDLSEPIAMLNLLRFDGETGRAAYGHYAQVAAKTIAAVGGALMYHGQVTEAANLLSSDGARFVEARLVRWNDPAPVSGLLRNPDSADSIRLPSVGSGLVTDGRWDELQLDPRPSENSDFEAEVDLDPEVAATELILAQPVESS